MDFAIGDTPNHALAKFAEASIRHMEKLLERNVPWVMQTHVMSNDRGAVLTVYGDETTTYKGDIGEITLKFRLFVKGNMLAFEEEVQVRARSVLKEQDYLDPSLSIAKISQLVLDDIRKLPIDRIPVPKRSSVPRQADTGYTKEEAWEILKTAMNQLTRSSNGQRRLQIMIGAKQFVMDYRDSIHVRFRHTPSGAYNKLRKSVGITKITYNPGRDDYTLTLMTSRGNVVKEFDGLYADQLKPVFEDNTGLFLSM